MKSRILVVAIAALLPSLSLAQSVTAGTPATPATSAVERDADPANGDNRCLRETGSRIRTRDRSVRGRCAGASAAGRAYTRDDLDRTGEINIAEALRRLDTSIY